MKNFSRIETQQNKIGQQNLQYAKYNGHIDKHYITPIKNKVNHGHSKSTYVAQSPNVTPNGSQIFIQQTKVKRAEPLQLNNDMFLKQNEERNELIQQQSIELQKLSKQVIAKDQELQKKDKEQKTLIQCLQNVEQKIFSLEKQTDEFFQKQKNENQTQIQKRNELELLLEQSQKEVKKFSQKNQNLENKIKEVQSLYDQQLSLNEALLISNSALSQINQQKQENSQVITELYEQINLQNNLIQQLQKDQRYYQNSNSSKNKDDLKISLDSVYKIKKINQTLGFLSPGQENSFQFLEDRKF